jgi:hypothetical protein
LDHNMFSIARRTALTAAGRVPKSTIASVPFSPSALRRLLSSLAILEQRDGQLNHGSLSAITAAKELGGSIHGFIAGGNIKAVAEEAAKVDGVEKIIAVDNAAYDKVCILAHPFCSHYLHLLRLFPGACRELCASTTREYQEGRLYPCHCRAHSIRKEPLTTSCRTPRLSTDIRYHSHRK